MYDLSIYNSEFYEGFGHEARKMSKWFLPMMRRILPFASFADVGCGEGWYLFHLATGYGLRDSDLLGIEGSSSAIDRSVFPLSKQDLRLPYRHPRKFDLAMSLEVAEHIEEEYAPVFVDTLCNLSDTVVMTAAPPGQGGLCHVNERPGDYWKKLFWDQDFHPDHEALRRLREGIVEAQDKGEYVTPWLNGNLMIFRRAA